MAVTSTMLELGTKMTEFTLKDARGEVHSSEALASAKAVLIAFWCNHCPYVIHLKPAFAEMTRRYKDQGLMTVAINANDADYKPADGPEGMLADMAEFKYSFPYLIDADQALAKTFRAVCTPDFYLFDGDGRLAYRGRFDASTPRNDLPLTGEDIESAIKAVLAGGEVSGEQQPSMGCSIKWKPGNAPDYIG